VIEENQGRSQADVLQMRPFAGTASNENLSSASSGEQENFAVIVHDVWIVLPNEVFEIPVCQPAAESEVVRDSFVWPPFVIRWEDDQGGHLLANGLKGFDSIARSIENTGVVGVVSAA
jgi:hypothetical protein